MPDHQTETPLPVVSGLIALPPEAWTVSPAEWGDPEKNPELVLVSRYRTEDSRRHYALDKRVDDI